MLAMKAIYNNGKIEFVDKPRYAGKFEILIIFPEKDDQESAFEKKLQFRGTREMDKILDAEPEWKPKRFIMR